VKSIFILSLSLLASTAYAETVTLGSETCTATRICYNVPNNASLTIDYISSATQYGRLVISIDGDIYDSGVWAYPNLAAFTIYDALGHPLSGSISISEVTGTCHRSGRVTVCPKTVTLKGATLMTQ
jgi:hypothetical protein